MIPAIVTVIVAVMAMAGIHFNDFGPGNGSQDRGNAKMITAAAVSRAGATEIPSEPPAGQSVKVATMIGPETYGCPGRRPAFQTALKLAVSLVALSTSLASLLAASRVGLALLGY